MQVVLASPSSTGEKMKRMETPLSHPRNDQHSLMRLAALAVLLVLSAALEFKYHNYNDLTTYLHDTVRLYPTIAQV